MNRYASRLLWATGGAFLVSYSAVQVLGKPETFEPGAGWYLVVGWLLLVLAALAVVGNPSASSRMAAHAKQAIIAMHRDEEAKSEGIQAHVGRLGEADEADERVHVLLSRARAVVSVLLLRPQYWSPDRPTGDRPERFSGSRERNSEGDAGSISFTGAEALGRGR
jgi:hypothetical protein